jgi:aromatic amino acid permease
MLIMRMLAEMTVAYPANGAFSVHAEMGLGRWAGFTVGWLYWLMLVVVLAIEATAAASIMHGWLPDISPWVWVLTFTTFFTLTNLVSVGAFGEFEFWFSAIKVAAILGFLVLGVLAIVGVLPGTHAVGLTNLTGHGGFLPKGWNGVLAGLLAVVFSFGGLELVTIAAAESGDPARAVGRAVTSSAWRILLFYVGSMAVVVTLLPWDSASVGKSPYVAVLDRIGVAAAGQVMNVVVLIALLSALNANLYGASRMLHSLALRGEAPRALLALRTKGVPYLAIAASAAFGFASVVLSVVWPDTLFLYLASSLGGVVLVVWAMVACTQLRLRRRLEHEDRLELRMWGYPYLTLVALIAIVGFAVLLLLSGAELSLLCSLVLVAIVVAVALVREVYLRRRGTGSHAS